MWQKLLSGMSGMGGMGGLSTSSSARSGPIGATSVGDTSAWTGDFYPQEKPNVKYAYIAGGLVVAAGVACLIWQYK